MAYICKRKLNRITMRKITEQISNAFNNNRAVKVSNTAVKVEENKVKMYLHGNLIATKDISTNKVRVTNCGWQSNVTKDRLNAISNVHVQQKKGEWFLNGEKWNGQEKEIN